MSIWEEVADEGVITKWTPRGFGFIRSKRHPQGVFAHAESFAEPLERGSDPTGRTVKFETISTARGDRAVKIVFVD
jgi:cold shock CspA family protein